MTNRGNGAKGAAPVPRLREGVARQARAIYESAHGNPVSDDARGMRWSLSPRVALTACLVVLICGAVMLWALRSPSGEMVSGSGSGAGIEHGGTGTASLPAGVTASASPGATSGGGRWGADSDSKVVIVDVAGHVATPGVREMPVGSRVGDAIDAAGGYLADAARDTPNLARVLVDGEQVYVPGKDDDSSLGAGSGKTNVNRGDVALLEALPGVGPVLAQRIVDYREQHGPFESVADLDAVAGIGPSVLAQLAEAATV